MTKEEQIDYWIRQIEKDFDCAKVLHNAGHYAQALFWAHLTLEKLCKALWIKTNESNTPPFIHNLLKIALETSIEFSEDQLEFFTDMNTFQIRGRYPDYIKSIEQTITKEISEQYLIKTKEMILWLQGKLQ